MDISVRKTEIEGVLIISPDCFEDQRGFFFESYHKAVWARHGIHLQFVQDNHSRSRKNVVRGFHFQDNTAPQYRVVRCTVGEVFDVVVDLRVGSPTFGRWLGVRLSAANREQLVIPPEFAHGFAVMSDVAEIQYKVSGHHVPAAERTLAWDDPEVAVKWPVEHPVLSDRDRAMGKSLKDYKANACFQYQPGGSDLVRIP